MKDFFKPEDFEVMVMSNHIWDKQWFKNQASMLANLKLNKLIESWPVVTTSINSGKVWTYGWQENSPGPTHKARLAFIEELLKEPCKHELQIIKFVHGHPQSPVTATCGSCGVELQAIWTEKK